MGASLIDVFIDKIRVLSLRNLAVGFVATGLVQSNAGMRLVDFNTKFILNSLDSKILAQ